MTEKQIAKQWHDATIQNNFVFGKTMELYPNLCRRLLEIILNTKIREIIYPEREKTIEVRTDSKGIRLDVYVEKKAPTVLLMLKCKLQILIILTSGCVIIKA